MLGKLYPPTCTPKSIPLKRKFDPSEVSFAEKQKKKKKAAVVKPKTITFVVMNQQQSTVPKGRARKKLLAEGRIKKLAITRSMSVQSIRKCIKEAFSELKLSVSMVFMCTGTDNILEVFAKQDLDGSEVIELAGSGSVYLTEVSKKQNVSCG